MRLLIVFAVLILAAPVEAQGRLPADAPFVASSHGSVYYPRACSAWRSLSARNLIGFADESAATAAGYRRSTTSRCSWTAAPGVSGGAEPAADAEADLDDVCTVARVVDGDTVVCREGNERVRLLLIDAPESTQGEYGLLATEALSRLLPVGTPARLERDVQERDRYGRILVYLYDSEGRMVNEELVRLGFAMVSVYPPNVRHVERIRAASESARRAGRGLWSGSAFECSPADHRAGRCR